MAKHLEGRVAVVTGGGGAIGRGICLELAAQGASVVVNDLGGAVDGSGASRGPADKVVDEIKSTGGKAAPSYDSVATMEGGEKLVRTALDAFGRIDIAIHTAGILRDRMVFNMTEEEWDAVLNVHLKGMFSVTKPAAILMRQQRSGRIIGFSSTSGLYGNPGQANYGAAKEGIAGFVRTVARDMGRYGVTVNGIAPAADTRMTQTVSDQSRQLRARATSASVLPRTPRDPDDVAPMTVYLCTDEAAHINGQMFYVAGGSVSLMTQPRALRTMVKQGRWTLEEIAQQYQSMLGVGIPNPAPPLPPKE